MTCDNQSQITCLSSEEHPADFNFLFPSPYVDRSIAFFFFFHLENSNILKEKRNITNLNSRPQFFRMPEVPTFYFSCKLMLIFLEGKKKKKRLGQ